VLSVFSELYRNEQLALRERQAKYPTSNTKTSQEIELKGDYEGLTILEALSATGLRSIRYAKEIPNVKKIIANDLSKSAVASIERNIKHNKVEDKVVSSHADAT
jgi:tRNA (guanine26-N2/guanine27-N2)-dimethyltransferase